MRIWLVKVGEPWPTDPGRPRLIRTGINARFLATRGHDVTYWSGTFEHMAKRERYGKSGVFATDLNFTIMGMHAGGYRRNISVGRIWYHAKVAREFDKLAAKQSPPDVIIVSLTPLELADAALRYGALHHVPVVVDVRDLWPDIWRDAIPKSLRPLGDVILAPYYRMLDRIMESAFAVTGVTESMIDWGLDRIARPKSPLDRSFPLVSDTAKIPTEEMRAARQWWNSRGLVDSNDIVGCFVGSYSRRQDFKTVLEGFASLQEGISKRAKLVFCGAGEAKDLIDSYAARYPNIINAGWVDAPYIRALMDMSSFGILPYRPENDFVRSIPNKVGEYLNNGLPILTCLRGEVEKLFAVYPCGILYEMDNAGSFRQAVEKIANPDVHASLVRATEAASKNFDTDHICREFEAYLFKVVDSYGRDTASAEEPVSR